MVKGRDIFVRDNIMFSIDNIIRDLYPENFPFSISFILIIDTIKRKNSIISMLVVFKNLLR